MTFDLSAITLSYHCIMVYGSSIGKMASEIKNISKESKREPFHLICVNFGGNIDHSITGRGLRNITLTAFMHFKGSIR